MNHDPRWFAEPLPLNRYPTYPAYPAGGCPQVEQLLETSRLDVSSALAWTTRAGWRIPYRREAHSYLWIVLRGEGNVSIDGMDRFFQVSPGDSFVIPEQAGHELAPRRAANFEVLIFHVLFRYLDALDLLALLDLRGPVSEPQPGAEVPGWRQVLRAGLLYLLYPSLCSAVHRTGDSLGDLASPGLRRLLPAFLHVRRNAHRHDLRVEEIAASAGVSEVYLRRLFKRHLHKTPHEFLLEERLARARDALIHSEATVDQVAESSGFENPSYFHRVFKRYFGTSPGAYRRQPPV